MTKLEKLLLYVSEHNEFYKNIIKEYGIIDPTDITQYPILTRQQLQENRYSMFSDGYKSKYFNQQLRRQSSSGSSGVPVNVYWDYKDWYSSNMSLWRKRLQWYGIHPSDKYVIFTLNAFNIKNDGETVYYIKKHANILSVNVSLIQNDNGYKKLVDIINEFEPKWFYIQPFVLNKLIQAYKCTGKIPPKTINYIESVGELLASDLRRRAIEFFEVPLANMYGSEEMNGIAYECPEHHMHVLDDNVFIEAQSETGNNISGIGKSIITNLNNFGMPLIRYNQDDEIYLDQHLNQCNFRGSLKVLKLLNGRCFNCIRFNNGGELNIFILTELIAEINNQFNDIIKEYKFIYTKSNKKLTCLLYIDNKDLKWLANVKRELEFLFVSKNILRNEFFLEIYNTDNIHQFDKKSKILEIVE